MQGLRKLIAVIVGAVALMLVVSTLGHACECASTEPREFVPYDAVLWRDRTRINARSGDAGVRRSRKG